MSGLNIAPGMVVHTKSIKACFFKEGEQKPSAEATFKADKGQYFSSILLGTSDGASMTADDIVAFMRTQGFYTADSIVEAIDTAHTGSDPEKEKEAVLDALGLVYTGK